MSSGPVVTPGSSSGPAIQSSKPASGRGTRQQGSCGHSRVRPRWLRCGRRIRTRPQHFCTGVVDDLHHLGGGQPPVHGQDHGPELGQSESHFEEFGAVLVDECHSVTETHPGRPEGVGGPTRADVELAIGDRGRSPTTSAATSPRSAPCTRTMSATAAMPSVGMAHLSMARRHCGGLGRSADPAPDTLPVGFAKVRLSSLPLGVRGSTSAKSTDFGSLNPPSRSRAIGDQFGFSR